MTVRLIDIPGSELWPTIRALSDAGMDSALAELVRKKGGGARAVAALRREFFPADIVTTDHLVGLPTWKTVTLGGHKDIAAYRAALQSGGYRISNYANQILAKTPIATTEATVDLVRLTVREMGFPQGATTTEIYAWAEKHGLKKCPAEVGPALRLAYADQPRGEWIHVGMEPCVASNDDLLVFVVGHVDDDRWLSACRAGPACRWGPGGVWVFIRSKQ